MKPMNNEEKKAHQAVLDVLDKYSSRQETEFTARLRLAIKPYVVVIEEHHINNEY